MAKNREQIQMQISNAYGYASREEMNARNYHIGYMLTDEQIMFTLAYEVAKQFQISIPEAYQRYNLHTVALKSINDGTWGMGMVENIIDEANRYTTPDKPTIILVNYKIITGANHWAPVIVTKNAFGQFSVTAMNSSTDPTFQTEEIKGFAAKLVGEFMSKVLVDASRDVQISNVCGLASANASGIGLLLVSSGKQLTKEQLQYQEQDRMPPEAGAVNMQEIPYCVQGRKTFAIMEYLSKHPNAIGENVAEVEKLALVECGILTQTQVFSSRSIDELLYEREILRFKLNKMFNDGPIPESIRKKYDYRQKLDLINKFVINNATPRGFNIESAMRDMEVHIAALWNQVDASSYEAKEAPIENREEIRAAMDSSGDGSAVVASSLSSAASPNLLLYGNNGSRKHRRDEVPEASAAMDFSGDGSAVVASPLRSAASPSLLLSGNNGLRKRRRGEGPGASAAMDSSENNRAVVASPLRSAASPSLPLSGNGSRKHRRDEDPETSREKNGKRSKTNIRGLDSPDARTLDLILAIVNEGDQSAAIDRHIALGTDLNLVNGSGETPLMCAVFHGKETYYRKLIEAGADLEIKGPDGKTVLEWAVEQNKLPLIKELLLNGASAKNVKVSIVNWSAYWLLSEYRTNPVKWLIDNHASRLQVANFVQHSSMEELQESVIFGLTNKGNLNVAATILEASIDVSFLNNKRVIGVLNEVFSLDKMKSINDEQLIKTAYFIMEKAHQVYMPAEIADNAEYKNFLKEYKALKLYNSQFERQQSNAHAY